MDAFICVSSDHGVMAQQFLRSVCELPIPKVDILQGIIGQSNRCEVRHFHGNLCVRARRTECDQSLQCCDEILLIRHWKTNSIVGRRIWCYPDSDPTVILLTSVESGSPVLVASDSAAIWSDRYSWTEQVVSTISRVSRAAPRNPQLIVPRRRLS